MSGSGINRLASNSLRLRLRIASAGCVVTGLVITGLIGGCGKSPPGYVADLVAVSGTVTLNKQPLEGAIVTFVAQTGPSRSSAATTDELGNYSMTTSSAGEGVLPGSYAVVISKHVMPDGSPVPADVPPMDVGAEEQLADRYSSFAAPTLSAEVGDGGGTFAFDLQAAR